MRQRKAPENFLSTISMSSQYKSETNLLTLSCVISPFVIRFVKNVLSMSSIFHLGRQNKNLKIFRLEFTEMINGNLFVSGDIFYERK